MVRVDFNLFVAYNKIFQNTVESCFHLRDIYDMNIELKDIIMNCFEI